VARNGVVDPAQPGQAFGVLGEEVGRPLAVGHGLLEHWHGFVVLVGSMQHQSQLGTRCIFAWA
jgi:hypothetical protein